MKPVGSNEDPGTIIMLVGVDMLEHPPALGSWLFWACPVEDIRLLELLEQMEESIEELMETEEEEPEPEDPEDGLLDPPWHLHEKQNEKLSSDFG